MRLRAHAVDGGRVFGEPAVEEFGVVEGALEVVGQCRFEGSENPPVAQATEFIAQRPARHLLGVGTQDGVEPAFRIRVFHLRSTFTSGKTVL